MKKYMLPLLLLCTDMVRASRLEEAAMLVGGVSSMLVASDAFEELAGSKISPFNPLRLGAVGLAGLAITAIGSESKMHSNLSVPVIAAGLVWAVGKASHFDHDTGWFTLPAEGRYKNIKRLGGLAGAAVAIYGMGKQTSLLEDSTVFPVLLTAAGIYAGRACTEKYIKKTLHESNSNSL